MLSVDMKITLPLSLGGFFACGCSFCHWSHFLGGRKAAGFAWASKVLSKG